MSLYLRQSVGVSSLLLKRPLSSRLSADRASTVTYRLVNNSPLSSASSMGKQSQSNARVLFKRPSGAVHSCTAAEDETMLSVAQHAGLEIEGACQGECACSTCHVIVSSQEKYSALEPPTEKENDMLDLAYGITETSRLGCQLRMRSALSGMEIRLPGTTQAI